MKNDDLMLYGVNVFTKSGRCISMVMGLTYFEKIDLFINKIKNDLDEIDYTKTNNFIGFNTYGNVEDCLMQIQSDRSLESKLAGKKFINIGASESLETFIEIIPNEWY